MKAPARSTRAARCALRPRFARPAVLTSPYFVERAAPFSPALWSVARSVRAWWFQRVAGPQTSPRSRRACSGTLASLAVVRKSKIFMITRELRSPERPPRLRRERASIWRNQPGDQPLPGRERVVSVATPRDPGKGRHTATLHRPPGGNGRGGGLGEDGRRKHWAAGPERRASEASTPHAWNRKRVVRESFALSSYRGTAGHSSLAELRSLLKTFDSRRQSGTPSRLQSGVARRQRGPRPEPAGASRRYTTPFSA